MKIVADENIPQVQEVFEGLGEVRLTAGREIGPEELAGAEVLLVRSVTKVNAELLEGTAVRFVGTATIGTDHIDGAYLARKNICFADAAGSNARSVSEYVLTALLTLGAERGFRLRDMSLGVIGVGNIGSKVAAWAEALGMKVLLNDPPRQREYGDRDYVSLEEVMTADIITCHVPLTREGMDATWHLFDEGRLRRLGPEQILVNSSRGAVVDNEALLRQCEKGSMEAVVLDVWEDEPTISGELLRQTAVGTPHIAGYSYDGKINGTICLYKALCAYLGQEARVEAERLLGSGPELRLNGEGDEAEQTLRAAMQGIYDIRRDDRELRQMLELPKGERGGYFDRLRKTYPVRREAPVTTVRLTRGGEQVRELLEKVGFRVSVSSQLEG